ncbi:Tetratricopeptide repeat protein [Planctomycetes bacterium CA13]|uniref:Tetratricopeptide repeat protein n=1 Tax=Novipirellula herctigrandis TaxID=2527986 RepID=A0A5C5Z4E9_9BACT|nr:Tetratricopeptide repeat protein [Planctomycetes bacterium CA13]
MFSDERNARIDHYETLDLDGLLDAERESPRDVDLLVLIGRHYLRLRQLDKTRVYYSRAIEIDPEDGWTHLYFGNLCYALSCYDDAETYFMRAAELLPDIACPHWCLGDVYDKMGYFSRTEHAYRRAVEIEPDNTDATRRLDQWLADKPG